MTSTKNKAARRGQGLTMSDTAKIHKMELIVQEKARQVQLLEAEHEKLRRKEAVMLQMVKEQGDEVYHLGRLLSSLTVEQSESASAAAAATTSSMCRSSSTGATTTSSSRHPLDSPAFISAVLKDVQAHELLQQTGHFAAQQTSSNCSEAATHADQPPQVQQQPQEQQYRTGQYLTAITPETVAQVRNASVAELAGKLLKLTRQLGFVLYVHEQGLPASLHSYCSLEAAVQEYDRFCTLLHTGAPKQVLKICSLDLQTLEEVPPPPESHWANVSDRMQLTEDQKASLSVGFQLYLDQATPLAQRIHRHMGELQHQLSTNITSSAETATDSAATAVQSAAASQAAVGLFPADVSAAASGAGFDGMDLAATPAGASNATVPTGPANLHWLTSAAAAAAEALLRSPNSLAHLDDQLSELCSTLQRIREMRRRLIYMWVNTVDLRQTAVAAVASLPYWVQPVMLCDYVWRQQQQNKQE